MVEDMLRILLGESVSERLDKKIMEDSDYRELRDLETEMAESFRDSLTPDLREKFDELISQSGLCDIRYGKLAYCQGAADLLHILILLMMYG